jgi:hypothetical protein
MSVVCAIIGLGTTNFGCRGTWFIDRADTPSGDPNAGDYHLAGVICDTSGHPINGVTLTIKYTRRYYQKRNADEVPDWFTGVEKEVRTVDGEFSVDAGNALSVSLLFEKDGFAPVNMGFETDAERGAPVIHKNLRIVLQSAKSSTR